MMLLVIRNLGLELEVYAVEDSAVVAQLASAQELAA